MTRKDNQLFKALLSTCRSEFYTHAFPQDDTRKPMAMGTRAFLHASLARAQVAARLLGFGDDPKAPYEILSTTASIVEGLKTYHNGEGPGDLMKQLRQAQAHHLKHRDLENPVTQALGQYIDCRTLPDTKPRNPGFGN